MLDDAIKTYKEAIRIIPKDNYIYFKLGDAYKKKGLFDEAIKAYENVVRYGIPNAGKNAESYIKELKQIVKRNENPDDATALMNLGHTYRFKDQLDEAINSYKEAV